MSVAMSLLGILEQGPSFGLQLKNDFEEQTGGAYPLNVGQVYTTLDRLERDGLVELQPDPGPDGQKIYEITPQGSERLAGWFASPANGKAPARDELVLKLIAASAREPAFAARVLQSERRAAIELLQEYTVLKREAPEDADLGWLFLLDSLIFQAEARVRWLDACEARLSRVRRSTPRRNRQSATKPSEVTA